MRLPHMERHHHHKVRRPQERTALGPTCYRVYSSSIGSRSGCRGRRGGRIYDLENGASGHLTKENRGAGLNDLDLQVDRGGGVPQGGIELDIELAQGIGNIAPDGDLA